MTFAFTSFALGNCVGYGSSLRQVGSSCDPGLSRPWCWAGVLTAERITFASEEYKAICIMAHVMLSLGHGPRRPTTLANVILAVQEDRPSHCYEFAASPGRGCESRMALRPGGHIGRKSTGKSDLSRDLSTLAPDTTANSPNATASHTCTRAHRVILSM